LSMLNERLALITREATDRLQKNWTDDVTAFDSIYGHAVFCQLIGEQLDGHRPSQPRVFGFVDNAHAARAEALEHAVVREGAADHGFNRVNTSRAARRRPPRRPPTKPVCRRGWRRGPGGRAAAWRASRA